MSIARGMLTFIPSESTGTILVAAESLREPVRIYIKTGILVPLSTSERSRLGLR